MGSSVSKAKNMKMSSLAYVRILYPFPYFSGCADIGKISAFSRIRTFIRGIIRLNTAPDKYDTWSSLELNGKSNEEWLKN